MVEASSINIEGPMTKLSIFFVVYEENKRKR